MLVQNLIVAILLVLVVVGQWRAFAKAGKPGWAAVIPVYSVWVLFDIVDIPGWLSLPTTLFYTSAYQIYRTNHVANFWVLAITVIGIYAATALIITANIRIAKGFGRSGAFGFFLLTIVPYIGWPLLSQGKFSKKLLKQPPPSKTENTFFRRTGYVIIVLGAIFLLAGIAGGTDTVGAVIGAVGASFIFEGYYLVSNNRSRKNKKK